MNNLCRISYTTPGAPLSIILTESSIRTTCDLTTYEPEFADDIPFDRKSLVLKTVMRGTWLFDAISELTSTTPEKLTMYAKIVRGKPFFALSAEGTLGSARVEFNNNPPSSATQSRRPGGGGGNASRRPHHPSRDGLTNGDGLAYAEPNTPAPNLPSNLLETFQLSDPSLVLKTSYKFSLIQKAARAMSVASKVSLRVDTQGVLSLQLMIEVDGADGGGAGGGNKCFVDFRIVPLVDEDDEEEDEGEQGNDTLMDLDGVGEDGDARGSGGHSRSDDDENEL